MRVTDVAERLSVAVSTAHRLLAMLVYRDFAEQRPDRLYGPGKVLRPAETSWAPVALLREASLPEMHTLVDRMQESANLMVLAGTEVRFVATVESPQILRVGDRTGRTLPAHLSSGGKAILAALPPPQVTARYERDADIDLPRLRRELALVRGGTTGSRWPRCPWPRPPRASTGTDCPAGAARSPPPWPGSRRPWHCSGETLAPGRRSGPPQLTRGGDDRLPPPRHRPATSSPDNLSPWDTKLIERPDRPVSFDRSQHSLRNHYARPVSVVEGASEFVGDHG
jgi:hypothetical protein